MSHRDAACPDLGAGHVVSIMTGTNSLLDMMFMWPTLHGSLHACILDSE